MHSFQAGTELWHVLRRDNLLKLSIEGRMFGKTAVRRNRTGVSSYIIDNQRSSELKRRAEDWADWTVRKT